ncbi:MAG TPA: asparagine synthase (glutamine-hydrolyzing) [Bacteriovoracaceae bacterium]|nr:asparagine synthase (glutamine-hydrolyzing) [Bacteriovoracaceae bacterium]
MCGIAGILAYRDSAPPVDQIELLQIRDAMVNRGPDGSGLWLSADHRVGLAHRRLSIIDLSDAGAQPMANGDGSLQVVFNGEIYNYRELRREMEGKGRRFRSASDTEVLLHLYAEHGADMVHHLRGMYAFAIWDPKNRRLFLARDPFGIKPLYFANDGNTFRFASQVKALLKGGRVDTSPESAGHVGFFLWGSVPEPYTLYKGVRALPAGSYMWVNNAGAHQPVRFFKISDEFSRAKEPATEISQHERRERLHTALKDSVEHHMVADVPVGVFLSSGLDSTTITALATEAGQSDLRTITLGFHEYRGTENDETPLAALIADHYGTAHQTQWVAKADFRDNLNKLLDAMDQPSIDGINGYFVSKAAVDAGLKVVLSGLGGDELFGGYSYFQQIPRMVKALGPFQSIPSLGKGFRTLSGTILKHFTSPKYAGLLEYGGTYGGAYLLRRGLYMPWELPELLDGEMVREGWNELQTLAHLEQTTQGTDNAHLKVTALETVWYMRNQLLRDTDWASMAHSLEIRVPLVDIELFKTVTSLNVAGYPTTKRDMASTPSVPLPDVVLNREKTGFSTPVREWLLDGDDGCVSKPARGLRSWADFVINNSSSGKRV